MNHKELLQAKNWRKIAPDKDNRGEIEVEDFVNNLDYQDVRNKLYIFALRNWKQIEETYKTLKIENLKKRDFQLWKPLLTISKVISQDLFDEVLKFAEKTSTQRKQDFISEGSMDYRILEIIFNKLKNGESLIYVKDLSERYNENRDKKIANKTISNHLDKLGFKDYREKDRNGSYFNISKEVFDIIVSPLIPDFSSQSSQSSHLLSNISNISDEQVTNSDECKKKDVTNVTNCDEYDEYITSGVEDNLKNKKNNLEKYGAKVEVIK